GKHRKGVGEDTNWPPSICIRQRRARQFADMQMIMMLGVGIENGFQASQAARAMQLRKNERRQMVPALERLVVGVPVVPFDDRAEFPPIDGFEQSSKDAIDELHARPFLSLDNRKGSVCADSAEHAPRHSESFPGQPCRVRGRVGEGEATSTEQAASPSPPAFALRATAGPGPPPPCPPRCAAADSRGGSATAPPPLTH